MMEVLLAETAGFCFGVDRAVGMVEELLQAGKTPLYTYGPIIHNEQVVEDFAARGVRILKEADLETAAPGTLVIRSHGISRAEQEKMEQGGFEVRDATCPFVKKIHRLVSRAGEEGRSVIITGDPSHPEVKAIVGWCERKPYVIEKEEEIPDLPPENLLLVVSQTTFHAEKLKKIVEKIKKRYYNALVVNTICNATQMRQQEAEELSARADAMIVIGGSQSSNTKKLVDICEAHCANTYFVQTPRDLNRLGFKPVRVVGITAGASTPKNIIEEVQNFVRVEF